MKHGNLLLPFLSLLSYSTVYSQIPEQLYSVEKSLKEISLSGMSPSKDGQDVPSMDFKIPVYRYPQTPLELDGYAVAPPTLQLEQVHIYVRHGAFLLILISHHNPSAHF